MTAALELLFKNIVHLALENAKKNQMDLDGKNHYTLLVYFVKVTTKKKHNDATGSQVREMD